MTQRQRKLAGTIACVLYLIVYCLVMMALGGAYVLGQGGLLEFGFFVVAGIAWLPPAMLLIRWMSRQDAQ